MKLAGLLLALVATAAAKDGFCKVAECKACKEGAGINYLASLPLLTRSLGSVSHDVSRNSNQHHARVYAWCVYPRAYTLPTPCVPGLSSLSSSTWFCSWPLTLPTTRHPFLPSFAPRLLAHHSGPHTRPWSRSRDLTSAPLASARRQLVGSSRNTAASHRRSATRTEQTAWPTRIALRAAVTEPGRGMLQDQDHVEPPVMGVQGVVAWAVSP